MEDKQVNRGASLLKRRDAYLTRVEYRSRGLEDSFFRGFQTPGLTGKDTVAPEIHHYIMRSPFSGEFRLQG